jgi:hypothetical protein
MKAAGDLGRGSCFEKQSQRLDQIDSGFFNRSALARNAKLWAQRDKTVILTLDNRGQPLCCLHDPSLHQVQGREAAGWHTDPKRPFGRFPSAATLDR